jgi:hypothetical protein
LGEVRETNLYFPKTNIDLGKSIFGDIFIFFFNNCQMSSLADTLEDAAASMQHLPVSIRAAMMGMAILEREKHQSPALNFPKTRKQWPRRDPRLSPWYKEYVEDERHRYVDLEGSNAVQFRKMFRMRRDTFLWFCHKMESEGILSPKGPDATGRSGSPLSLLILAALSILGGGVSFLFLVDMVYLSERVMRQFFLEFCHQMRFCMFPIYCKPPTTNEEIENAMSPYKIAGLDGCIGSACFSGPSTM